MKKKMNKTTYRFLLSQLHLQEKAPRERRFTQKDKIFALSLYKHGPRAYRLLQKIFSLPSKRTLLELLIPNETLLEALAKKIQKKNWTCAREHVY